MKGLLWFTSGFFLAGFCGWFLHWCEVHLAPGNLLGWAYWLAVLTATCICLMWACDEWGIE